MHKMIVTLAIVAFASITNAQSPLPIEITYDDAGNRITRKVLQMSMMSKGESQEDSTYYLDKMQTTEMKVYPNPTKDLVNVQLTINNEQIDDVEIQLFDVYGSSFHQPQIGIVVITQIIGVVVLRVL